MPLVVASSAAMTAVAGSALALNRIAKNTAARTSFAGSAHLQNNAAWINTTLTNAPTSLFTRKATNYSLSGAYGTTMIQGVVGLNSYGNYQATTTSSGLSTFSAGALFVFVRTLGYANTSINNYNAEVYHLQTNTLAGSKPLSGLYNEQNAKFICVGGSILRGTINNNTYIAGMSFDAWQAV
jgi:hypothetical protein